LRFRSRARSRLSHTTNHPGGFDDMTTQSTVPNQEGGQQEQRVDPEIRRVELQTEQMELRIRGIELELSKVQGVKWNSPLGGATVSATVAVLLALVAYIYNSAVESERAKAQLEIEKAKLKTSLIISSVSTGDTTTAAKNLKFFVDIDAIADPGGKIARLTSQGQAPVLPARAGSTTTGQPEKCSELVGAQTASSEIQVEGSALHVESCAYKAANFYVYFSRIENKSIDKVISVNWPATGLHSWIPAQSHVVAMRVSSTPPVTAERNFFSVQQTLGRA
jgi:hypothetical protein